VRPTQHLNTFREPLQTKAAEDRVVFWRGRGEPLTVVLHRDLDVIFAAAHRDAGLAGPGVFDDVVHALLDDTVDRDLLLRRKDAIQIVEIGNHRDLRLKHAAFATTIAPDVAIVAERSMYWPGKATPWGEAHNSTDFVAPGLTWDVAEGREGGEHAFHTYILLSNPQTTAANVTVTFLREDGPPVLKDYVVGPSSRLTIGSSDVPELSDRAFGARIAVTNGMPILVERSLYWNANDLLGRRRERRRRPGAVVLVP
jgi:hypothetical protein